MKTQAVLLIFHFATAAFTSLDMSSFACFFALSVIPSSLSKALGDVSKGSNSSKWPSRVGTATRAAIWPEFVAVIAPGRELEREWGWWF